MKKVILLIMLSGLLHKTHAQSQGGFEQYYFMGERQAFTMVPIVYYETSKSWYMEGRYNYEAENTMSVYAGKTFEKKSEISYSASPIIGVVMGKFNGGSVGLNGEGDYKKCSFSSQLQYTFSLQNKTENFLYCWSDFSYQALNNMYAGISIQQTNLYQEHSKIEKGFFIKGAFRKWTVPLYVFSPSTKDRYFVLGLTCDW